MTRLSDDVTKFKFRTEKKLCKCWFPFHCRHHCISLFCFLKNSFVSYILILSFLSLSVSLSLSLSLSLSVGVSLFPLYCNTWYPIPFIFPIYLLLSPSVVLTFSTGNCLVTSSFSSSSNRNTRFLIPSFDPLFFCIDFSFPLLAFSVLVLLSFSQKGLLLLTLPRSFFRQKWHCMANFVNNLSGLPLVCVFEFRACKIFSYHHCWIQLISKVEIFKLRTRQLNWYFVFLNHQWFYFFGAHPTCVL